MGQHSLPKGPVARIALVWESYGPTHFDRLRALQEAGYDAIGIEFSSRSNTYAWDRGDPLAAGLVTLFGQNAAFGAARLGWRLFRACRKARAKHVFLCHYHLGGVFLAAMLLRLFGHRVHAMADSKFDDMPRMFWREGVKLLLLTPYCGALVATDRSAAYFSFLGVPPGRIALGYNGIACQRAQAAGKAAGKPGPLSTRPWIAVARLVPEKDIAALLQAYAGYRRNHNGVRQLEIHGDGPERAMLEALTQELGIATHVSFHGWTAPESVLGRMRQAFALLVTSRMEPFSFAAAEALACGLPVIASRNAGVTDSLVENLVNGFVIAPGRPEQLVRAMLMLEQDEALWQRMSAAALASAERGGLDHFVAGVRQLIEG